MAIQKTTEKSHSTLASPVRILTQQLELPALSSLAAGTPHQGQQHGQPSTQLCPGRRSTNTTAVKAEWHCPGGQTGRRAGHSEDVRIHSSALSGGSTGCRTGQSEDARIHSSCDAKNTQEQERKPASYRHFTKKGRAGPCT